jgi:hypothetical protein
MAEVGKGARSFQPRVRLLECADGVSEQRYALVAARHESGGSLRDSERNWKMSKASRSTESPRRDPARREKRGR